MSAIVDPKPYAIEIRRRIVHWTLRLLPMLVTAALVALLLRSSSLDKFLELGRHFDAAYLALSAILLGLTVASGAISLLILFDVAGHPAWRGRFIADYFYVQALCQLTPAQAGEVALPYVAGRGRFAPGEIAASLVIQRMIALAIIVLFALTGAGRWAAPVLRWSAAGLVLFGCLIAIAMIRHSGIRNWLSAQVDRRFGPILYGFHDTWTSIFRERRVRFLFHVVLMIVRFVAGVAAGYAVLLAFDVTVPFWAFAALTAWTTLAVLVPVSINGIGVVEGIYVAALASYGNGTEQVLAACLAGRLLTIVVLLSGSAVYWFLRWRDRRATVPA